MRNVVRNEFCVGQARRVFCGKLLMVNPLIAPVRCIKFFGVRVCMIIVKRVTLVPQRIKHMHMRCSSNAENGAVGPSSIRLAAHRRADDGKGRRRPFTLSGRVRSGVFGRAFRLGARRPSAGARDRPAGAGALRSGAPMPPERASAPGGRGAPGAPGRRVRRGGLRRAPPAGMRAKVRKRCGVARKGGENRAGKRFARGSGTRTTRKYLINVNRRCDRVHQSGAKRGLRRGPVRFVFLRTFFRPARSFTDAGKKKPAERSFAGRNNNRARHACISNDSSSVTDKTDIPIQPLGSARCRRTPYRLSRAGRRN